MTELAEVILPYLVGPFSGLIITVCLLVGLVWMGWRTANNVLGPLAKQWLDNQNIRFDRLLEDHAKDREAYSAGINVLAEKILAVDNKVEDLDREITDIKRIVERCDRR